MQPSQEETEIKRKRKSWDSEDRKTNAQERGKENG